MMMARALAVAGVAIALVAAGPAAATADDAGPTIVDAPFTLGAPEATARVSPGEVRLGERFTLLVTAVYGGDVRVNLPEPLSLGPAFEVRRSVVADRRRDDGRRVREWQIEVIAWELGDLAVPPVPVTFTSSGRAAAVDTDAVPLRVVAVLGDADAKVLRGLAPPIEVLRRDWTLAAIAAGLVAVGALGLALWRRRRRSRGQRPAARARRRALGGAAADALGLLDELEASGLLDRDRKAAFVAMSDVMREYLGRRYGFSASDQTTGDLERRLDGVGLPATTRSHATRWLVACDRVKFANHHAAADEARAALAAARALVTATARPEATGA